jgi:ATP-dependent Clp protease ATP-binding subunit ClpC
VTTKDQIASEELLNSFDGIAPFVPLESEHVREVARRMLARFNGRLQMEHNVSLDVTPELIDYIAQKGFSEEFGVHSMAEVIRSTVEDTVTQLMRKGSLVPGQSIGIDPRQFQ